MHWPVYIALFRTFSTIAMIFNAQDGLQKNRRSLLNQLYNNSTWYSNEPIGLNPRDIECYMTHAELRAPMAAVILFPLRNDRIDPNVCPTIPNEFRRLIVEICSVKRRVHIQCVERWWQRRHGRWASEQGFRSNGPSWSRIGASALGPLPSRKLWKECQVRDRTVMLDVIRVYCLAF